MVDLEGSCCKPTKVNSFIIDGALYLWWWIYLAHLEGTDRICYGRSSLVFLGGSRSYKPDRSWDNEYYS